MFNSPGAAYEAAGKTSVSSRQLEATALFKAARMLETCRQEWDQVDRSTRLEHALHYNQRLWTFFQAELSRPGNPIDPPLRDNLLRLSACVDKRTFELLGDPDPEKLRLLVDINRNVAAGLVENAAA
ncbi:MAG: flagellar biosynthesis regulator FlaF [Gemmatimonadota bacterium]